MVLISFLSCHQDAKKYNQLLIGEWTFASRQSLNTDEEIVLGEYKNAYAFFENGICENKLGYYYNKPIENDEEWDKRSYFFLGTTTKYKIEANNLSIFNLSDSTWETSKIISLSSDKLILQSSDSSIYEFKKANYKLNKEDLFDQIIVSASGCYGTCPINDILISKVGKTLYNGDSYNTHNGLFTSQISLSDFLAIEKNFKKANIEKLQDSYYANWTDDEEITVSFVKNDTLVKTILDYGGKAPLEFYLAYSPVRYLYQNIKLDTLQNIPPYLQIQDLKFIENKNECSLSKSESFYLWSLLLKSTKVYKEGKLNYNLDFFGSENILEPIQTDGRYYRFQMKDKQILTLDIGFNFLERNKKVLKFKKAEN